MTDDYGFAISKQDRNVLVDTSPLDYTINSRFNTLKVWRKFQMNISVPSMGEGANYYNHGLARKPAFLAYYKLDPNSNVWWSDRTAVNDQLPNNDGYAANTVADNQKMQFLVDDAFDVGARTCTVSCILFADLIDPVNSTQYSESFHPLGTTEDYGIKISKPGIDVTTAQPHQLHTSSKYPGLKFHMQKTVSFTITAGNVSGGKQFKHGLGYVPAFVSTIEDFNDNSFHATVPFGRVPQPQAEGVRADTNNIYVGLVSDALGFDVQYIFHVIVFKDRIAVT